MFSTIVVPLDGSTFGERSLPTAAALASRSAAALDLVHVHQPAAPKSGAPVLDSRFDDEMEEHMRERVRALAETLARVHGLNARAVFLHGQVAPAIQDYVADRNADLVALSTHGRGGLSRAWLGSVADHLVRRVTAPVLLLRPDGAGITDRSDVVVAQEPLFRRILVPLDGSPRAEEVLTHAAMLGTPDESEYLLVRVVVPRVVMGPAPNVGYMIDRTYIDSHLDDAQARADEYLAHVAESLREIGARVATHTAVNYQAGPAILDYVSKHRVDLIVLSARVRSAVERLLLGSVVDKVVRGAQVPVLLCGPRIEHASAGDDAHSVAETGAAPAGLSS